MLKAIDVAEWFVNKNKEDQGKDLSLLKLTKILYFCQGWFLAEKDKPLFDDDIVAWEYGPTVRAVNEYFERIDRNSGSLKYTERNRFGEFGVEVSDFLNEMWKASKDKAASEMVNSCVSHRIWKYAFRDGTIISKEDMRKFFKNKA
jgi:uncharacterized phage-associated protein